MSRVIAQRLNGFRVQRFAFVEPAAGNAQLFGQETLPFLWYGMDQ